MGECKTCGDEAFPNETYCSKSCEVQSDFALGRRGQEIKVALPDALPVTEFVDDADVKDGWTTAPPPPFHRSTLFAGGLQHALEGGYLGAFLASGDLPAGVAVGVSPSGHVQVALGTTANPPPFSAYPPFDAPVLPTDSEERKEIPIFSGVLNYFPLAIAAVARISKRGNDKHNAGQPLHWARGKSMDHPDCIARHLIDLETVNAAGEYEDAAAMVWRALAQLQQLEEKRLGKPMSRGSK